MKSGSLTLMIQFDSPKHLKMCLSNNVAVFLAVCVVLQGMNTPSLERSWSTMTKIVSKPCESGNLVVWSMVMTPKGQGDNGTMPRHGEGGVSDRFYLLAK